MRVGQLICLCERHYPRFVVLFIKEGMYSKCQLAINLRITTVLEAKDHQFVPSCKCTPR